MRLYPPFLSVVTVVAVFVVAQRGRGLRGVAQEPMRSRPRPSPIPRRRSLPEMEGGSLTDTPAAMVTAAAPPLDLFPGERGWEGGVVRSTSD